jgi:hypothetical protein
MRLVSAAPGSGRQISNFWLLLGLLGAVLLFLFFKSLVPHQILFANDVPLGARKAECNTLPGRFTGTWGDLSWLGGEGPAASPSITMFLATLLSPVLYLKVYAPFTLLFLGFSAWLFFRQLNFSPMVCVLGGVAAGLNSHFLSIACWGLGNWNLSAGCMFLAMAALRAKSIPAIWERAVLAGLAVGMVVMEGYDVGAILSVFIGVYIIFRTLSDDGPITRRVLNAFAAETLVVLFAAIFAYHTIHTLVRTEVEGVAAMGQDAETKQTRWRSATQWSLPKMETLQVMIPGVFGYRLSGNISQRDHSGAYWGRIGQDPRIATLGSDDPTARSNVVSSLNLPENYLTALNTADRHSRTDGMMAITKKSGIYWRYTGSGECAGTIVSLLALFGLANFFRKDQTFSKSDHAAIGFWGMVALFSLLAAWGRFAFVYQFLYRLPYVSTIRNPIKFMHPFHIAWIILAAYGMEVLYRRYICAPERSSTDLLPSHLQRWWAKAAGFDRKWTLFMMILAGVSVVVTALLFVNRGAFIRYLQDQSFTPILAAGDARTAGIATFCIEMCAVFVVFLTAGMLVIAAILSGAWTGTRQKLAWASLATLLICDLVRADLPWIHYYDYAEKYALNPITEFLYDKPWEHRVIGKLEPRGPGSGITPGFGQLYFFWLQNDFPYHNIQTLDFPQMSHMPDLDRLYLKAFELAGADIRSTDLRPAVRLWQLTNTRYILATASAMEFLNQRADPIHHSFKLDGLFNIARKPNIEAVGDVGDLTVQSGPKGEYGIIEYPLALPRAKLFAYWRTPTNDEATLDLLTNQEFDPWKTVLIATNTPLHQPDSTADAAQWFKQHPTDSALPLPEATATADPGTVAITDYRSKYVRLEADAKTPAVLLLNDRFGADWQVRIDGASNAVLRCNYIMRGVYVSPGHHIVEFVFKPSLDSIYISVSAIIIGMILAGYLITTRRPSASIPAPAAPSTKKPLVNEFFGKPLESKPAPAAPSPPSRAAPAQAAAPSAKGQKGTGKTKRG